MTHNYCRSHARWPGENESLVMPWPDCYFSIGRNRGVRPLRGCCSNQTKKGCQCRGLSADAPGACAGVSVPAPFVGVAESQMGARATYSIKKNQHMQGISLCRWATATLVLISSNPASVNALACRWRPQS